MYINKPSVTKIVAADRVSLLHSTSCALNSTNLKKLFKCLYPYLDMRHSMIVPKKFLLSDIEF